MNFAKEKRTLLGWAALLAPLPLPLNDVLEWPVLFVYAFLVIHFLQRVERGAQEWLPNWALNLLGLVYLPILAVDLRFALMRDQAVKALMHLILFLLVVKLYSIRREKEKWHVFVAIFFVFVAAMGTSSHLTISFYLLGALALGFGIMARFAHLHMLAALGREPTRAAPFPPVRWSVVTSTLLVVLLSIPIFAAMPRLRQPFVMGQGGNNLGLARTTGFSDRVDLNITSRIRGNRSVAMRVRLPDEISGDNLRFKAATYDYYRDRNWHRELRAPRYMRAGDNGTLTLPGVDPDARTLEATIFLEPLDSTAVVLPTNAVSLTPVGFRVQQLSLDPGGAVYFTGLPPRDTVQYRVELAADDHLAGLPLDHLLLEGPQSAPEEYPEALDVRGVTPRIADLAARVVDGEDDPLERVRRIEGHLLNEYGYTTDFVGRDGLNPIEDFLFQHRSGHCEYFASAMVLMLRSEGIPARLVTGFLGAELNPIEDYYIVRQQNAHAWVEAWTGDRWRIFDPTPPDGRPAAAERDLKLILQQIYDYVAFRWDRYVLTYGSQDQQSFFQNLREQAAGIWAGWMEWWQRGDETGEAEAREGIEAAPDLDAEPSARGARSIWQDPRVRYGGLAIFLLCLAAFALYMRRRMLGPIEVYDRLRRGLRARGLEVGPSTAPLDLQRLVERDHPEVADDARRIVGVYLDASFAGRAPAPPTVRALRPALERVLDGVSEDLRRREKEERRGAKAA